MYLHERLIRWIEEFGFFELIHGTNFDPVLSYVAFLRCCEAGWTLVDLEDLVFLYYESFGEVIGLEE